MKLKLEMIKIAKAAQEAARKLAAVSPELKNRVLKRMAARLLKQKNSILQANRKDIIIAAKAQLSSVFIDRLTLNEKRIAEMADSLLAIARLPDSVGQVIKEWKRPNGLLIKKVRTPIGVIAIIYESRPNVTSDCVGLTFKSGNSVILRGGSESLYSNIAIFNALRSAIKESGIPEGVINLVTTPDRKAVDILLGLNEYIDLVMPRGGESLIRRVVELSRIPVIKHYKGICHVYVDRDADLKMAMGVCFNAKVQRPGVCNAMESMLVHKGIAARFLPGMARRFKAAGVQLRGCPVTCKMIKPCRRATERDFHTEYLDLILSVRVVNDIHQAIEHINYYGSHHSDSIITRNKKSAHEFLKKVDSACVYVNASTRFTDGYQFGLGAEIGISTDKLHARGPMALEELTTYKYTILGNGQIRE
ncbi:MAG: glutamate-5-semialdehyde dehydrogenase [Candidatus Omnitrophica bacterium]|nr:glutamate-5-semialdehyde dehydrogenase [Candidatus Omnitrophota bacterium]